MSITSMSLSGSSFNQLPIEIIADQVRPYLTFTEACLVSRTSRCFFEAFNSNKDYSSMKKSISIAGDVLKELFIKQIESIPVAPGFFNQNRDDPKYVFSLRRIPGDKVWINFTCPYRKIAAQNNESLHYIELKIEAVYKSNLALALPEVIFHQAHDIGASTIDLMFDGYRKINSPDTIQKITGYAQSCATVLGAWAIAPILIPSELIARIIKSNSSKINLFERFSVELELHREQIAPSDEYFIRLCILKLKYLLNTALT